jgi:hypothetical protein
MRVAAVRKLEAEASADERAAELERMAQELELLRLQPELSLQVVERRRTGVGEMAQQRCPLLVLLHAGELIAADRVDEAKRLVREQDRLALVHLQLVHVGPLGELEVPGVLRRRPGREPSSTRDVRLLVACFEEARQRRVRRPGEQAAVPQELVRLSG